jgi:hypothetical protein
MTDEEHPTVESLLPYDDWADAALRQVAIRALAHVAAHGLPGQHHFYITFRTDHPGVVIPPRLRAQYPQEMTIVLQHKFWDLKVDEEARLISVGLSFGGVPSTLVIPVDALLAFADPHVNYGMRFRSEAPETETEAEPPSPAESTEPDADQETPQVVSLDAFRRRPPTKN